MTRNWIALTFAMTYPTVTAWCYFVALAGPEGTAAPARNPAVAVVYAAVKAFQFAFPMLWVWWAERRIPIPGRPRFAGLVLGLGFGVVVAAGTLGLYYGLLRDQASFGPTPARVQAKLVELGLDTPAAFVLFGAFLAVAHSFLEEYYWRWFVFGELRHLIRPGAAIGLSSIAFAAHHVIVLAAFFPGRFWEAAVPFSACVAAGGAVWAWLYHRSGSIYSSWISHLLVDAAIMAVGYDLAFVRAP